DALDIGLPFPERLDVDLEVLGDELIIRCVPEAPRERLPRASQIPALLPNRAGDVVLTTQLIQNGSADAGRGEGAEGEATRGFERIQCVHQPDGAAADELVEVDVRRQRLRKLAGHVMHEAEVLVEQSVPKLGALSGAVIGPEGGAVHSLTSERKA